MSTKQIAIVKWEQRPYALVRYEDNKPGLIFGIVRLVDCKTKWDVSKPIEGDKVKIRLTNEFNRIGKLKCIGTYNECCSTFTTSMINYINGSYYINN